METTPQNKFKTQFKYYKRRQPPPSFEQVLDVRNAEHGVYFSERQPSKKLYKDSEVPYINDPSHWRTFSSKTNPGFHVITNTMSLENQMVWARRSLENYSSEEFKRNIDLPGSKLDVDDWYKDVLRRNDYIDKLRWSTLGYHHDWDTKVYSDSKSVFPSELFSLCSIVADAVGYPDFKAQAAIVNFYPMSGTLSSHTDHSELNTQHPIISISLGQSAIFLLGGSTLEVKPTSYLLQSGDIVVMEKDARLAYHAVPRIVKTDVGWTPQVMTKTSLNQSKVMPKTSLNVPEDMSNVSSKRRTENAQNEPELLSSKPESEVFEDTNSISEKELFCVKYLASHRININARQVH